MRPSDEEVRMTLEKGAKIPYRIVMRRELGERYAAAFDGMQMEVKDGETILVGEIVDQSHLLGVLNRINGLGLQLLSVQALQDDAHPNAEGGLEPESAHEATAP
jgi:outer membrane PBP1 activator LpoA protein